MIRLRVKSRPSTEVMLFDLDMISLPILIIYFDYSNIRCDRKFAIDSEVLHHKQPAIECQIDQ